MRLIDADALLRETKERDMSLTVTEWDIKNAPTVDAVEVVRCRECVHWSNEVGICWCDMHSHFKGEDWNMFDADDYCSYGERRNDD